MSNAQLEAYISHIHNAVNSHDWIYTHQQSSPQGLYIHIPFCEKRCYYCDFYTIVKHQDSSLSRDYVRTLLRHLAELNELELTNNLMTAYIGGGTPSMLGDESFCELTEKIAGLSQLQEFTSEMNPESARLSLLESAKRAGLTRISFGVQSFNDAELTALGRAHDSSRAIEVLRLAHTVGYDTSLDLMCAIPKQSDTSWETSLKTAISLNIDHISIYPLQIEDHTVFARYKDDEVWHTDIVQADRMSKARALLEGSNFVPYEVASYAKEGKLCQHNLLYWCGYPYLALGSNASGMLSLDQYQSLQDYIKNLPEVLGDTYRVRYKINDSVISYAKAQSIADLDFDIEFLSCEEAAAEDLMLGFRLSSGPDNACVSHACSVFGEDAVINCLQIAKDKGLINISRDVKQLYPTQQGWLMGNALYEQIWELV